MKHRAPRTAECPRCGCSVTEAAGLFRCPHCGGFNPYPTHDRYSRLPVPPREHFAAEDPTKTKPIDGRPMPIDRRIK